jgi:ABC-type transporter Mla maintaining outer membrane lipid asymmetry permease subunit MlaE
MHSGPAITPFAAAWGTAFQRRLASWWHLLHFGSLALVVALSPSTYRRANRQTIAVHLHRSTWEVLPWFTALSALLSLVLIHIVLVSAQSYGLSKYALEMVVRVLVLELIPLSAALFVALRSGLVAVVAPGSALLLTPAALSATSLTRLQQDLVPRLLAIVFSVLALAACSSAIAHTADSASTEPACPPRRRESRGTGTDARRSDSARTSCARCARAGWRRVVAGGAALSDRTVRAAASRAAAYGSRS